MTDIKNEKESLRKRIHEKRKNIPYAEKMLWDQMIKENLSKNFDLGKYEKILCYHSLPDEVDTLKIIDELLESGKKVFLPKTMSGGKMEFFAYEAGEKLVSGDMGVLEPLGDSEKFFGENTLCIVPGLCFSEKGERLGHGAGYYDKFLCEKNFIKIALSYGCFIEKKVPCLGFDVKMDYIITQDGVIDCAEKSGGLR